MPSDYLLEIEGIKGESKDSKHPNTLEIESFSWGNTNDGSAGHGSGAGAGKVHFQDFHFTSQVNKASAELMLACATGKHIKKAQLFVRKQGENQQDYYTVTMEDFIVDILVGVPIVPAQIGVEGLVHDCCSSPRATAINDRCSHLEPQLPSARIAQ